jgi:hypothetical protein
MDTFSEKGKRLKTGLTHREISDSGMAFVLIALIVFLFTENAVAVYVAFAAQILNMTIPLVFKPFAWLWLGFSKVVGAFISRIILAFVFYFIVTPVAIIRKLLGKDTLLLKRFKKGTGSVFVERNKKYDNSDIVSPF